MKNTLILIISFIFVPMLVEAQFTYSGYIRNANGSGASNFPVKLYRRTNSTIAGFTSQNNYNGHSYYRSTGTANWTTAKSNCVAMGGHLVTVTSSGENSFLFGLWPSGWIGLTDEVTEGTWKWVTGETFSYTNWNSGEPNNSGNEDYIQFVSGGRWNDLNNSSSLAYVIEFDYIVTTSSWALYKTIYTNSSGYYSISETYDPSKEYYIQLDAPTPATSLSLSDVLACENVILKKTTLNGIHYYQYDITGDNRITVADAFYISARRYTMFSNWINSFVSRLFTTAEYNAIKATTADVRGTYPGTTSVTTTTLTSAGTLNYYIIAPGYSGTVAY